MSEDQDVILVSSLRRNLKALDIVQISVGSIIGSGWLFASLFAAQIAGPASIVTWVIAALAMLVLALNHAELGSMFHISGGSARFAHFAFGTTAGFTIGWLAWLSGAATAPIEVEATLQYATNYIPGLTHSVSGVTVLQPVGYVLAVLLLAFFTVLNLFAIKLMGRINSILTWWKIGTILLVIITITVVHFDGGNFTSHGGFAPFGIKGVLSALSLGGVVFAFTGFEQAVQLGGETKNPGRNIPIALWLSIGITTVLYIGLQIAFVGGLNPNELAKGWSSINFNGIFGPFAALATALGIGWLALIVYFDAIVSPGSNGLVYITTTSRISYALARTGYIPALFAKIGKKSGVPFVGVISSFVIGVIFFLPFPGWQTLVGFITSSITLMWAGVPISLGALRRQQPHANRPFRLKAAWLLAPLGFVVANMIVYWGGWNVDWKIFVAAALGFIIFGANYLATPKDKRLDLDLKSAAWVWPWFGGSAIISYLGTFSSPDKLIFGLPHIPFGPDIILVAAWSLLVYYIAMAVHLPADRALHYAAVAHEEDGTDDEDFLISTKKTTLPG